MIRDVNSAYSQDQSAVNFRSTAARSHRRRYYGSSFWTSKEVYETSHNSQLKADTSVNNTICDSLRRHASSICTASQNRQINTTKGTDLVLL